LPPNGGEKEDSTMSDLASDPSDDEDEDKTAPQPQPLVAPAADPIGLNPFLPSFQNALIAPVAAPPQILPFQAGLALLSSAYTPPPGSFDPNAAAAPAPGVLSPEPPIHGLLGSGPEETSPLVGGVLGAQTAAPDWGAPGSPAINFAAPGLRPATRTGSAAPAGWGIQPPAAPAARTVLDAGPVAAPYDPDSPAVGRLTDARFWIDNPPTNSSGDGDNADGSGPPSQGSAAENVISDQNGPGRPISVAPPTPSSTTGGDAATTTPQITADQLRQIFPQAGDRVEQYVGPINDALAKYGLNTRNQQAAFLGQAAVENPTLRAREEDYFSSFTNANHAFGRTFPTPDSAAPYLRNPEAMANRAYALKNGNGDEASGDGERFRGGGMLQTTGRANYRAVGLEDNPESIAEPAVSAAAAGHFWSDHGLNDIPSTPLTRQQFDQITRTINGRAMLKADERWAAYGQALNVLNGN
jgi:putative chitinase